MTHWTEFLDPSAPSGGYLPWKEVARRTSLSRTTAWRLQKRDEFPAPYAISPGRVGYREDEVEAWRVSRDHSGARGRPLTAASGDPPVAATPSTVVPPLEVNGPSVERASSDEVASAPAAPSAVAQSRAKRAVGLSAPRRGKPGRRSQHAQAIAQQILFDF